MYTRRLSSSDAHSRILLLIHLFIYSAPVQCLIWAEADPFPSLHICYALRTLLNNLNSIYYKSLGLSHCIMNRSCQITKAWQGALGWGPHTPSQLSSLCMKSGWVGSLGRSFEQSLVYQTKRAALGAYIYEMGFPSKGALGWDPQQAQPAASV